MLVLINLLGAVALLLWGTHMVQTGVLRAYGTQLRRLLGQCVQRRISAFFAGLGVTALVQSGTATTLMISAFVVQGLIQTQAALTVVLGADVGSSLIAQVFSVKAVWLSPALLLIGVVLFRSDRSPALRNLGRAGIGLGLMILALQLIGQAMLPITRSEGVRVIFESLTGDIVLDVLFAALLTFIAHSSLAIILLIVSLVDSHTLSPLLGLALVLGANIGSALSPLLSGMGAGNEGRRVPLSNLVFKVIGCLLVSPFLSHIHGWLTMLDADPARQILHFHTAFNLAVALVFMPLTGKVARLAERLLPARADDGGIAQPRHLDMTVIETPEVAVSCAAREALRIGDLIDEMLRGSMSVLCDNDEKQVRPVELMEDNVDRLYKSIKLYLARINREELSPAENQRWADIIALTINLEHIGDIIDKNLLDLGKRKLRGQLSFSETGNEEIREMHMRVIHNLRLGLNLFMHPDPKGAQRLIAEKYKLNELERQYADSHLRRLAENKLESVETSALHLDAIRDLRRINSHVCSLAYPILDAAGMLVKSRVRRRPGDAPAATGRVAH